MADVVDRANIGVLFRTFSSLVCQDRQQLDVQRVLAVLHAAALHIQRTGSTQARTIMEVLAALMGISWTDVLDEAELKSGPTQAIPEEEFTAAKAEILHLTYHWEALGVPIAFSISVQGEVRLFFNDCFTSLYLRDAEHATQISQPTAVPFISWASLIAPEDQTFYWIAFLRAMFGATGPPGPRELNVILNCVQWDGTEALSKVKHRVLYSTHGLAQAFSIHPLSPQEVKEEQEKRLREVADPQPSMLIYGMPEDG